MMIKMRSMIFVCGCLVPLLAFAGTSKEKKKRTPKIELENAEDSDGSIDDYADLFAINDEGVELDLERLESYYESNSQETIVKMQQFGFFMQNNYEPEQLAKAFYYALDPAIKRVDGSGEVKRFSGCKAYELRKKFIHLEEQKKFKKQWEAKKHAIEYLLIEKAGIQMENFSLMNLLNLALALHPDPGFLASDFDEDNICTIRGGLPSMHSRVSFETMGSLATLPHRTLPLVGGAPFMPSRSLRPLPPSAAFIAGGSQCWGDHCAREL